MDRKESEDDVTVIWTFDPLNGKSWEWDWINHLLPGENVSHIIDAGMRVVERNVWVVCMQTQLVRDYLLKYQESGTPFSLIHLSDEWYKDNLSVYELSCCRHVFRNYYFPLTAHPREFALSSAAQNKVRFFALGYKYGWHDASSESEGSQPRAVNERKFVWNFVGAPKGTRKELIRSLSQLDRECFIHQTAGWNAPNSISTKAYRDVLENSMFTPSPIGNFNIDCFRLYEALEAGSIPIVIRSSTDQPYTYYERLFECQESDLPFVFVDDWKDAKAKLMALLPAGEAGLGKTDTLIGMQSKAVKWWVEYKMKIQQLFKRCSVDMQELKRSPDEKKAKTTTHPIGFCVPESLILARIPKKTYDFAPYRPGQPYQFFSQEEYYNGYRNAFFAITHKKAGWDCLRHYEILMNGCMCYFTDLAECPIDTMTHLPKDLIARAMKLPGVKGAPDFTIDHSVFPVDEYMKLMELAMQHCREHLTTTAMARYVFNIAWRGREQALPKKVLLISGQTYTDYQRCLLLHGMRTLLGAGLVDVPRIDHMYVDFPAERAGSLYGRSFTYARWLKEPRSETLHPLIDRENKSIQERIRNHAFDLVVFGSYHRGLPLLTLVQKHYKPGEVVMICGDDLHECDIWHRHTLVVFISLENCETKFQIHSFFLRFRFMDVEACRKALKATQDRYDPILLHRGVSVSEKEIVFVHPETKQVLLSAGHRFIARVYLIPGKPFVKWSWAYHCDGFKPYVKRQKLSDVISSAKGIPKAVQRRLCKIVDQTSFILASLAEFQILKNGVRVALEF
jgi:hypothetical protein